VAPMNGALEASVWRALAGHGPDRWGDGNVHVNDRSRHQAEDGRRRQA
jgi:hypothetical protein